MQLQLGLILCLLFDVVYGVYRHFQQYFSYIAAVNFISGGNRNTWRKPLICRTSLLECDSNSQR